VSPAEVDIDLFIATRTLLALIFFPKVKQRKSIASACTVQDTGAAPQSRPEHWHNIWLSRYESAYVYDVFDVREFLTHRTDNKIWPSSVFARLGTVRIYFSIPTLQIATGTTVIQTLSAFADMRQPSKV